MKYYSNNAVRPNIETYKNRQRSTDNKTGELHQERRY